MATFYYEFDSAPDEHGKRSFTLCWEGAGGRRRGQCFRCNFDQHRASSEARGSVYLPMSEAPAREAAAGLVPLRGLLSF